MKINELNTPVLPDTYEASMFLNQTIRAGKYAIKIHNMIDNDQEMESWVAKKLDLASSYISSVGHYLEGQEMSEDAGEGHMAKSQMYKIAKYCLKISTLVKPGDDIEAWVQTKMNRAVDMLDAVYHYEDYQRLNPYREQLEQNVLQKHSQVIQKNIDEILSKETPADDIETKPGMLNILKKRVQEVEKKMCREKTEAISKEGIQQGFAVRYERDGKRLAQAYKNKDDAKKRASELKNTTGVKDISITQHTFAFKEDEINEDPRAVGKALANIKYGKEIADAILKGTDIGILKVKANAYLSSIDDTLELLNQMYPSQYNKNESALAERMPAQIIKNKQKLAYMSDRELANHLKDKDETTLRQMAWRHGYGKMSSHYWDRVQRGLADTHDDDVLDTEFDAQPRYRGQRLDIGDSIEEGLGDWMKKLAAAGIIVGAVAGMGSINNAIDNSVPAIQAMNTAYEMAVDAGNDELAKMIKTDISDAKVRLSSGKDLNHIKYLQDKYSKFMSTESVNEYSMAKNNIDLIKQKQDKEAYQDKVQTLQQIQNDPNTNKDELLKKMLMKRKEKLATTGESKTVLYTNRLVDMMGKKLGETWTFAFKNSLKS